MESELAGLPVCFGRSKGVNLAVYQQMSMALVAVPDGFKDSRKLRGENVEGQGGVLLRVFA